MKKPESSVTRAWRLRGQPARRGAAARAGQAQLDLVLPRGWPESAQPLRWRLRKRGGAVQSGEAADLKDLPPEASAAPACVWTPAAETLLTTATIPTRSRRKIAQALPYALEDRLVGDPQSLHFAYRNEPDGSLSVAITSRARLDAWIARLRQDGIRPVALCPATLLLPWALDCWSLAFLGDELLVRTGAVAGFVCPSPADDEPPGLLVSAAREAAHRPNPPEAVLVFQAPAKFPAGAWTGALGLPVRAEKGALWERHEDPQPPINLLQSELEQGSALGASLRPYLPAAAMLLAWLAGSLAFDATDWWKLRRQHAALQREMTDILLATFPETRVVLDPAAQMQRNVETLLARSGRNERELLSLLAKATGALRADPRVRLRGLRYADRSLTLELAWPASASPDAFKRALEAAGLHAEMLALAPRAGEVEGRVRLQPATSPPGSGP